MERMKKISMVCVLLACVAPVLAATFYELPTSGNYGTDPFTGYNYNPTPDTGTQEWADWTAAYQPPYTAWTANPYYEISGETLSGLVNDPTVELRSNMTTNGFNVGANLTAGTLRFGDGYWPLNYSNNGTTYTTQDARQTAGAVTVNTFSMGRNQSEWASSSMATQAKWNIRGGSLNIVEFHNLSSDTTVTTVDNRGLSYGGITTEIGSAITTNMEIVNIGDIYLNDNMTFFHMNAGKWTITGDILQESGAAASNAIFLLCGNVGTYTANPDANRAQMVISESTLMEMIANGWLWKKGATNATRFDVRANPTAGTTIDLRDLTRTNVYYANPISNFERITTGNMNYWLRIVDVDGEAGDMVRVHVVPEPATLVLLGLGSVVTAFRRKR